MNRKKYFYICEDCDEVIPQRLDVIKGMLNPRCRTCSNKRKGKENRDKISETLTGRKLSIEHCRNMSKGMIGREVTIETRNKIGNSQPYKGTHHQSNTGRTHFKRGKEHPLWIEDRSKLKKPEIMSIRESIKYIDWRKEIFERDGHCCQICHEIGGTLNAHHIKSFNDIIKRNKIKHLDESYDCDELWNINNGITLCESCHLWIHRLNPLNQQ